MYAKKNLTTVDFAHGSIILTILFLLAGVQNSWAQVLMERSFFVEDSTDHTALGFAKMQFSKISDPMNKVLELRANSRGVIELTGVVAKDSITFKIQLPGYKTFSGRCLAKDLYLSHILLQPETHSLTDVTVHADSRKIRMKPGEMQIHWNKFMKNPSEPLASVIKRLPTVLNKSLDKNILSLETGGGKKISVYLDGRKLSDQEVNALPAMMIARASLITFPSALDAADNTAVLYLSSKSFAYNYSYNEINLNYDIGRTGPGFTLRHAQKKGLWSNNVMVNGYHYKMPASMAFVQMDGKPFQRDTSNSKVNALLVTASITKKSVKNNLFTLGLVSNLFKGSLEGQHHQYNDSSNTIFSSTGNNTLINATLYAAWRYKTVSGNTWLLHASSAFQPDATTNYRQISPTPIFSSTSTKEQQYSLSARYLLRQKKLKDINWNSSFSIGTRASYQHSDYLYNQKNNPTPSAQSSQLYAVYGGLSSSVTGEQLKIEASLIGNYAWQKGYQFLHFNNGYIYPKLVLSYAPDDNQSISLSLLASTLRPDFKMAVTDSNYRNNWIIQTGNQALKTEHDYHLDLLYNLSLGHFNFEAEGEQIYYNQAIVQVWDLRPSAEIQLISSYLNLNYVDRSLSLMAGYDIQDALYLKINGHLHHLSFKQSELPEDFKDGYYLSAGINISYYSKKAGNYAFIGSWDGNPLLYLKKTYTRPSLSFSYDYDLSKTLNISAGFSDILSTGNWKKTVIYKAFHQLSDANYRTVSVGFTWKFGQLFGNPAAGSVNAAAVPNDTKKL